MKNYKILIALMIGLAVIIVGAAFLYKNLSVQVDTPAVTSQKAATTDTTQAALAPDFTVYDANGNAVQLRDMAGKPTVINFWATWCGYCVQEMPHFDKLYAEYGETVNFMMVDLTDGERETEKVAQAYIRQQGYTFPLYFDKEMSAADAYRISSIPVTLFIDKEGKLAKKHLGAMDEETLRAYLEQLQ